MKAHNSIPIIKAIKMVANALSAEPPGQHSRQEYAKYLANLIRVGTNKRLFSSKSSFRPAYHIVQKYAKTLQNGYGVSEAERKSLVKPRQKSLSRSTAIIEVDGINVQSNEFLLSRTWRELRYLVLKRFGAICQCCGTSAKEGAIIHVDHIKPRHTHPKLALDINNLQILCEDCNIGKGAWDSTDWR